MYFFRTVNINNDNRTVLYIFLVLVMLLKQDKLNIKFKLTRGNNYNLKISFYNCILKNLKGNFSYLPRMAAHCCFCISRLVIDPLITLLFNVCYFFHMPFICLRVFYYYYYNYSQMLVVKICGFLTLSTLVNIILSTKELNLINLI